MSSGTIDNIKSEIQRSIEKHRNSDPKNRNNEKHSKRIQSMRDLISTIRSSNARRSKAIAGKNTTPSSQLPSQKAKKSSGMVMNKHAGELTHLNKHEPGPVHQAKKTKTFGKFTKAYKMVDRNKNAQAESVSLDEISSDLVKKARDAAFKKDKDDQAFRFVKKAYEKGKKESDEIGRKMAQEDVAANNVGGGAIAGTQGDAGKKVVMTKEPLKRKKLTDFKEWIELEEAAIDAQGHKSSTGGLTQKGRDYYNNKTGGNLQAPVTKKPSELKPGSKAANRRKSFCARMGGMKKRLTSAKTANDPDSRINKALRKWNC